MKKIILGIMVLATVASCKKDKNDPSCEKSVAGIAASYKITKVTVKSTGLPETDVTSSVYNACELAGVYQLKTDKSVIYSETLACGGSGIGTWDVLAGGNFSMTFVSGNGTDFPNTAATTSISGWDCNTLVLSEVPTPGQTYNFYFTKQ
ncbi:MAG: hypothetical protein ABIO79_08580 [Ferruginibacter sp.]